MFKKTKVRGLLELLGRNTVAEVQALFLKSGRSSDDISEWDDDRLYELFKQRSGNNSTIFVGQYPVDEWHNRTGGGTQADSIMEKIIHNVYEIPTNETNLRKLYDSKKLKKLIDEIDSQESFR